MSKPTQKSMTPTEAARLLGIKPERVKDAIKGNAIQALPRSTPYSQPRITFDALQNWVNLGKPAWIERPRPRPYVMVSKLEGFLREHGLEAKDIADDMQRLKIARHVTHQIKMGHNMEHAHTWVYCCLLAVLEARVGRPVALSEVLEINPP